MMPWIWLQNAGGEQQLYMCIRRKSQGACVYDPSSLTDITRSEEISLIEELKVLSQRRHRTLLRIRSVKKELLSQYTEKLLSHNNKRPAFSRIPAFSAC